MERPLRILFTRGSRYEVRVLTMIYRSWFGDLGNIQRLLVIEWVTKLGFRWSVSFYDFCQFDPLGGFVFDYTQVCWFVQCWVLLLLVNALLVHRWGWSSQPGWYSNVNPCRSDSPTPCPSERTKVETGSHMLAYTVLVLMVYTITPHIFSRFFCLSHLYLRQLLTREMFDTSSRKVDEVNKYTGITDYTCRDLLRFQWDSLPVTIVTHRPCFHSTFALIHSVENSAPTIWIPNHSVEPLPSCQLTEVSTTTHLNGRIIQPHPLLWSTIQCSRQTFRRERSI